MIRAAAVATVVLLAWNQVGLAQQGLPSRPANLTCQVPDRPQSNSLYELEQKLAVDFPVAMVQAPGDTSHWYVIDRSGIVLRYQDGSVFTSESQVLDLRDRVQRMFQGTDWGEMGLLGIAFDPDFQTNGFVYVYYSADSTDPDWPLEARLSRFTSTDGGLTFSPASEVVVLRKFHDTQWHWGGSMVFGTDGYLYATFGDAGRHANAQNLNKLQGKMIRIDINADGTYSIPPDNPFVGGGGRPEIYAYGLRNPWRFSFDAVTNDIWEGDVGSQYFEEVNFIEPGGNYGWSIMEGDSCSGLGTCTDPGNLIDPVYFYPHDPNSAFNAIIGGYIYRGSALPDLYGKYVFGDNYTGRVTALTLDSGNNVLQEEVLIESGEFLTSFAQGPDNEIYLVARDGVHKLVAAAGPPPPDTFPQLLSETGCMDPSNPSMPAPGLIPYTVNTLLWSDGADKERFMALPDGTTIIVEPDLDWTFPIGTVLVKQFSLGGTLIETRLFMRHADGGWAGYTYEWNDSQTDATLLRTGITKTVNGQSWHIPSESQCMQCHTLEAGRSLGLETAQLNGDFQYPSTGITANQLGTLEAIGMFSAPLPGEPQNLPALASLDDSSATIEHRARSYLHANCANCHREGGPGQGPEDFRYWLSNDAIGAIGVDPTQGDLGVPGAKLILPGSPSQSILSLRMHALDGNRMPPLGTSIVDIAGTTIIDSWIASLSLVCTEPVVDSANVGAIYVWKDCTTNETHLRMTGGGAYYRYTGSIESGAPFQQISGFSLESHDSFSVETPSLATFDLQAWGSSEDGIDLVLEPGAGTCLRLEAPAEIRVGGNASVMSAPIDIETFAPCAPTQSTLGEPAYDPATEAAFFVWTDVAGRWYFRATPGGSYKYYIGRLTAEGPLQNVVPQSIEQHDVFDAATQANVLSFELKIWNGFDGFDLDAPSTGDLCLEAAVDGLNVPVIVGASRLEFTTPLNLRDLTPCTPPVSDFGPPTYDPATDPGIFVWQREDGLWQVRVSAGGDYNRAIGSLTAAQDFTSLTPYLIEPNDVFNLIGPGSLDVDLRTWGQGQDGFDFRLPAGADACFNIGSATTGVFFGGSKTPITPPTSLLTGTACSP